MWSWSAGASSGGSFFFFQAEDGIRDVAVTGVQTCALPIYHLLAASSGDEAERAGRAGGLSAGGQEAGRGGLRTGEGRGGGRGKSPGLADHLKKKTRA